MQSEVGDAPGKISAVVLQRARSLYIRKSMLAKRRMRATSPSTHRPGLLTDGHSVGKRLYLICESLHIFAALPVGHGMGVKIGNLDMTNAKNCDQNFGNALNSNLTMGGNFMTDTMIHSYKGEVMQPDGSACAYSRPFINLIGEGETSNAPDREIGVHPTIVLDDGCYRCQPDSPHAERGYVFYSKSLLDYSDHAGRTDGCLGMPMAVANTILGVVTGETDFDAVKEPAFPTTIYVYPQQSDIQQLDKEIDAFKAANKPVQSLSVYWNSDCLKQIGEPRFWDREPYTKVIKEVKAAKPKPSPSPSPKPASPPGPMCAGSMPCPDNLPTPAPSAGSQNTVATQ